MGEIDSVKVRMIWVFCLTAVLGLVCIFSMLNVQYWEDDKAVFATIESRLNSTRSIYGVRGNICSDESEPLVVSVPEFIASFSFKHLVSEDFNEDFDENVAEAAKIFSSVYPDKSAVVYEREMRSAWKRKIYYRVSGKPIGYSQVEALKENSFIGRYCDFEKEYDRVHVYGDLAARTLGRVHISDDEGSNEQVGELGLEDLYDAYLRGEKGYERLHTIVGKRLYLPDKEASSGAVVNTSLNIRMQSFAYNALNRQMIKSDAEWGTAIVMDVESGEIKAIANLGKIGEEQYKETYNYALGELGKIEPGSTFKLASFLAAWEDNKLDTSKYYDINWGFWAFSDKFKVYDSDYGHSPHKSLKPVRIFELSSNVGTSKIIYEAYGNNRQAFMDRLYQFGLTTDMGVDFRGVAAPWVKPVNKWSASTPIAMSFGYELELSPLHVLAFYNAIANDGKFVKPKFVRNISVNGEVLRNFKTEVVRPKICSETGLKFAHQILEGVVEHGTATNIRSTKYKIAGKTGTAKIANRNRGYADGWYQASFVGYFPADKPKYSCIVTINRPHGAYYGGSVAGPVFKEIADNAFAAGMFAAPDAEKRNDREIFATNGIRGGRVNAIKNVSKALGVAVINNVDEVFSTVVNTDSTSSLKPLDLKGGVMPNVLGMNLSDALYMLESEGLRVDIHGAGSVVQQSIPAGTKLSKGRSVTIKSKM
ncbi:MAG: penicillin-binding protein [Bacteroidales bacterium]